ncbi:hypothetical protein NEUTE1DRAFT_130015 [Neurospora tetrasperma FGSC 2508]|uniref:Uncharacterized protein n=1 Tax=Neurospora tetrasperma (strain FGSC 2508 / ATCC MYA-4615 / P0657) TaxID=510951 RepID=F8MKQ7_NEUT8|nr:uncharacterized protein NEUTE1DRAFT_130015 [Neurospora tetrasperma FGSC 2508]EGO58285.1 hypothetical protein NEUTE1DRAFT_130015 [Neurospora tetrasperma FGSC 2508]EGZ71397.1 hypothetical protein NEUTE2DRAFT_109880 [Neurospora tetrasperma FGSC 2509]
MQRRRAETGRYFEEYQGPTLEQWEFLVNHLQTPNLRAQDCLETVLAYMVVAVKHESTWKTRMMREDYFPISRLYYCAFLLVHPHFEVPAFWQMGMHILHMLSTLNYPPAILTMYRYFEAIARRRDPKSETYRYIQTKYQELLNKNDANACTWKAAELWDPKKPEIALMYLNKAMEGYKRSPGRYKVEPLVSHALEGGKSERLPFLVKILSFFSDVKETMLGLVVGKETSAYALRRRLMLDKLLPLDKRPARVPHWTWEGMYRVRKGMALSMMGEISEAVEELRIAADELDVEQGHYALAVLMQMEAEKISDCFKGEREEEEEVELVLSSAFIDFYKGLETTDALIGAMRLLNEEAELRFKRAAQGGDEKAAGKLERLCKTRLDEPGLSKMERETYKLAAKEWAELSGMRKSVYDELQKNTGPIFADPKSKY